MYVLRTNGIDIGSLVTQPTTKEVPVIHIAGSKITKEKFN